MNTCQIQGKLLKLGLGLFLTVQVCCDGETRKQPTAEKAAPAAKTPEAPQKAQATDGIPPLVADPPRVDFGIVEPGSDLSANVTLLNTSNRPMRILSAQPSCTCTTVDMTNVVIPARGTVQMPISMKTNRAVGKKLARVQLIVQGYTRFFTIDIDAENAWAVRAIPPHLSVKEKADTVATLSGRFALDSIDKRKFRVLSVLGEEPQFDGFDPATDEPRSQYVLKYDFTNTPCEEMPPFLIIRTDHPLAPLLDVRVRHNPCTRIVPALPMGDYRSNLGILKPGQAIEVPLTFKKLRRPRIESVTSASPLLQTALIDQTADGKELETITIVKIAQDAPDGLFQVPVIYSDGETSAEHIYYGWVER